MISLFINKVAMTVALMHGGLSLEQAQTMLDANLPLHLEAGVEVEVKSLLLMEDKRPELNRISNQGRRLIEFCRQMRRLGIARPRKPVHGIYPPMEGIWTGGIAFTGSYRTRYPCSISNAWEYSTIGNYRLPHAMEAMRHENNHVWGAFHIDGVVNIMRSAALADVDAHYPLPTLEQTKTQITKLTRPRPGRRVRRIEHAMEPFL